MPAWLQTWPEEIMALLQVVLVVVCALLLRWLLLRLVRRVARRYELPAEIVIIARRTIGFLIGFAALLLVLRVLGVSGAVLWGAFTGFATVAAVAFFALWSVLTNVFCALLILITRPFRLLDHIELVESGDKPGLRGRVIDMNLVYVTLEESHPGGGESVLRVPNSLFFQRATRRWRGEPPPRLEALAGDAAGDDGGSRPPGVGGGGSAVAGNFP
ncbi:mechanosensitive ion channel domain-containing protein [Luteimonas sp. SDU82]|uniref:mechanosensitive ion channel domain-containing protein n=2 Tax=unclassified Luteimonas TaxID=2629088 RepID=UPI003EBF7AF9